MSEIPLSPLSDQPASLQERAFDRRKFLALFVAGPAAAVALGACGNGEGDYYPDGGFPSDPSWLEPTAGPTQTEKPAASTPSTSAQEREMPKLAGERVEGIAWKSLTDDSLAASVRRKGAQAHGDGSAAGITDRRYLNKAIVIGVPAEDVKGETVHVALVTLDDRAPHSDKVLYTRIPRENEDGESQLPGTVRVKGSDAVYPYRVAMGDVPYAVAFVTGEMTPAGDGEKPDWKVEATHLISPKASVGNPTYKNAPLIA